MGKLQNLKINQIIEFVVNYGEYAGTYPSRIEGIDADTITVAAPIKKGYLIPITVNTPVELTYLDQNAIYSMPTEILERKTMPIPLLVLKKPEHVNRTQRRDFVRWDTKLPLTFTLLDANFETILENIGKTTDLSGGGLKFTTTENLQKDDVLNMEINLPGVGSVTAICQILRVKDINEQQEYTCSAIFNIIDELERDKIIHYIFNQQRELRAKGLL